MKALVTLSALLVLALVPFASRQTGPPPLPPVSFPMGGCSELTPQSKCLACCLSGYQESIEICKDACTICRYLFGLIPISCHVDKVCFNACLGIASQVHEVCQRDCYPPPPPGEEEDETPPTP